MINLKIEEQHIAQTTSFGTAYLENYASVSPFFHYSPYEQVAYEERIADLGQRSFDRQALTRVMRTYLSGLGITPKMEKNLQKLEAVNSVVVIGGQQAGLLLGPLYTLHKAITILQLAKQQEEKLGVPVVPVFWIAGEDHDFQEINHTFLPRQKGSQVDKIMVEDPYSERKWSMADRPLPKGEVHEWLNRFFEAQPETEFTPDLRTKLFTLLEQADTYVDFFSRLMQDYFGEFGLLILHSADPHLRKLESSGFKLIIEHYDKIDTEVRSSVRQMQENGYSPQVQLGENPALLFIYEEGERLLLEKRGDEFQTKDGRFTYSAEELLDLAETHPQRLSNNVITRPFMQEILFPTLAFVGGPGEIAYWALYRSYFESLNMKLPILAPRISMTFIEKPIAKTLHQYDLSLKTVFEDFRSFRREWLREQDDLRLEQAFEQTKEQIAGVYQPLLEKVQQVNEGMYTLGQKNLGKIREQVEYLQKRTLAAFEAKHTAALRQFDKTEQMLIPHSTLQERIYNPFIFFNKHGSELLPALLETPLAVNGKHKLIYLHADGGHAD